MIQDFPGQMDLLPTQNLNDLLSEAAQPDSLSGYRWMHFDDAHDISFGRVRGMAQEQVRRRQVEETESMRLDNLSEIHESAQFDCRLWNLHGQQPIPGFR